MIIDAHTHFYPKNFGKLSEFYEWTLSCGETHISKLMKPQDKNLQIIKNKQEFLEDMQNENISASVLQSWYYLNEKTCMYQNEAALSYLEENKKHSSDKFYPLVSICPNMGEKNAIKVIKQCKNLGFCGVGEICDKAQNSSFEEPFWQTIFSWCELNNFPVFIHMSEFIDMQYLGYVKQKPNQIANICKKFPKLKIVLAHLGGGMILSLLFKKTKEVFQNVSFDTAAVPLIYKKDIWQILSSSDVFREKIIFGSDYPLNNYPSKQNNASLKILLDESKPLHCHSFFAGNILNILNKKIK